MKEVIKRMLKVEEEARAILEDADRRTAEVREEHRRKAEESGERIRSEAHEEVARRLEEARLELKARRDERLRSVDEVNEKHMQEVRARFGIATDLVVKRLIGEQD